MAKVADPSQELRFSRSVQALLFAFGACLFLTIGVILLMISWTVFKNWEMNTMPFPIWVLFLPWIPMVACLWLCWHCVRHPFLILSPAGVEIFPFWRPVKNYNLIPWGVVKDLDINEKELTLHYNTEHTGGVVLRLAPLSKKSRILLMEAIRGVKDKRIS